MLPAMLADLLLVSTTTPQIPDLASFTEEETRSSRVLEKACDLRLVPVTGKKSKYKSRMD